MSEKLRSEIERIDLDEATYEGTGAYLTPTYVNFLFGNNGTGKSTIARAIKSGAGVMYADGKRFEDYNVLVYNQEFINNHMKSYHNLGGIFTFDEANADLQDEFDKLNGQMTAARRTMASASAAKEEAEGKLGKFDEKSMRDQYSAVKVLRDRFPRLIPSRLSSSKVFIPEVRKYLSKASDQDVDDMQRQYDAIYGGNARTYDEFPLATDPMVLENISGSEILDVVIVNTAQTDLANFLAEIGATEWMRQAHETYHATAKGKCPYCARKLDDDFEEKFTASFDNRYEENLKKLNAFLEAYKNAANVLYLHISKLPEDVYPGADEKQYREKLSLIKNTISGNLDLIKSKIGEPSKKVVLTDVSSLLDDLNEFVAGINKMIRTNNEAYNANSKIAGDLRDKLFSLMAYQLQRDFKNHDNGRKLIQDDIDKHKKTVDAQKTLIGDLQNQLRGKQGKVKDTTVAMKNINDMLRDANFQGFEMRPHEDRSLPEGKKPINYEVVRTSTGKVADDLSEGEKNFIAFLYFLQKVFGFESEQEDTRAKIVVIDDPVSSMDSSTLFIVGEQVRKMVEICRNNADNRDQMIKGNFIKQIFVLTHNAYFHREVTYPHADRYEFVSFYLVRKSENKSSVRLCDRVNPDEPTERVNVNPVKNSYAALWDEYKEVRSAVPLMNTIRRILEYYFIQLCGYDGGRLRQTILEDNKDKFTHDPEGNEDYTKYDMASTMLSYIAATSYGVNDGLHYVDDGVDTDLYRKTFRMIFNSMDQGQHYNMMMGIKGGSEDAYQL